jgi:hypothetical protein
MTENTFIVMQMVKTELGKWLDKQHLLWQMKIGEKKNWGEFADYLGFSRQTLDRWSRGAREPDDDSVELLAIKCEDDDIYEILNIPKPDPRWRLLSKIADVLSEQGMDDLVEYGKELQRREQKDGGDESLSATSN